MSKQNWLKAWIKTVPEEKKDTHSFLALQARGMPVWAPRGYHGFAREGYQKNPVVHRCVRLIAEAAASVPLKVKHAGEISEECPVSRLLEQPNPDQSGPEFLEHYYSYLQVSGNAFVETVLVEGAPHALYNLRPDRMQVLPGTRGWPEGWEYHVKGVKKRFIRDKISGCSPVLHMRLFHPDHDYYGLSPLEAAACSIDIHNKGSDWTKSLLNNAARPSGALIYKGQNGVDRLSDDHFQRLKEELAEAHQGAQHAGRPFLLEGGLDWKPMSMTPADMDFINARREAARDIALALGVPPMLLGIPGDNTYANYKEAQLAFWRTTILPLVRKTASAFTSWLKPWFEYELSIKPDTETIPLMAEEKKIGNYILN